jgi:hypothetical protein
MRLLPQAADEACAAEKERPLERAAQVWEERDGRQIPSIAPFIYEAKD